MDFQKYIGQTIINKWIIDDYVGQGRYGMVFKAHDLSGDTVAVKIIELPTPELLKEFDNAYGGDSDELEDFVSEVANKFVNETESMMRISSNDDCQNIIKYIDHSASKNDLNWKIIIIMEFATPLRQYIAEKPMTVLDIINLGIDIVSGLERCHSLKIIHRDIKEDNIFYGANGRFKIGDFGVANMTTASRGITQGVGSEYYMAPEVKKGEMYTGSVDIYSLGIVLYKLFNYKRYPFMPRYSVAKSTKMEENDVAFKKRMSGADVPDPEFAPPEVAPIINKACAYDKDKRYKTAIDMKHDLEAVKGMLSDGVLNSEVPYPRSSRRRPVSQPPVVEATPQRETNHAATFNTGSVPQSSGDETSSIFDTDVTMGIFDETGSGNSSPQRMSQEPNREYYSDPNAYRREPVGGMEYASDEPKLAGESTVGILRTLGTNSRAGMKLRQKIEQLENEKVRNAEKQKRIKKLRVGIISVAVGVVVLAAALLLIWPQTYEYRAEKADGYAIHKYQFGFDKGRIQKNDDEVIGAYYLDCNDPEYLYFSQKEEELVPTGTIQESPLYKIKRDGSGLEKISDKHCEYDVYYDGFVYFVSYYEDRVLCRVRPDGTYDEKDDGTPEGIILLSQPIASMKMIEKGILELRFDDGTIQKYDVREAKDDYKKIIEVIE